MAQVPYSQGVPDAQPQVQVPDDYSRLQPTAAEGLAELGKGIAAFGAGASKAGAFFGQASADNAFNSFQENASKLLYGDPSKSTPGPNGNEPDTGFLGLKGRAALDARPGVEKQVDALIAQAQASLQTPEQKLEFDNYARRYKAGLIEKIGSHSDRQATTWYGQVNDASYKNALDRIANDPLNPQSVAGGAADAINAAVKSAQLAGASPGDEVWTQAIAGAKRDALKIQVQAIGATDPAAALRILDKNRGIAGQDYDNLYSGLKEKADKQVGTGFATDFLAGHKQKADEDWAKSPANPAQPVYRQAAEAMPGGMSPNGIARTVQIESGGRAGIINQYGYAGLGQFGKATWREFGAGGNPLNPQDAIMAIQRYAASNAKYLSRVLGRPPTDAELYLAHQQGPGGAAALLRNPNASAASVIGMKRLLANGGRANMTAGEFAAMWTHKFDGTQPAFNITGGGGGSSGGIGSDAAASPPQQGPTVGPDVSAPVVDRGGGGSPSDGLPQAPTPPTPAVDKTPDQPVSTKAAAYQAVAASDMTPEAKQYAYDAINRQMAAQQIAEDATAKQRKDASDQAADGYVKQLLGRTADPAQLLEQIANDPNLEWQTRRTLAEAVQGHADTSVAGAEAAYGPGFWSAYKQVSAPMGDPSRISDVSAILQRAGPGGDLTLAGASKLIGVMQTNAKSVDGQAVQTTKMSLLSYAKSKLSFQQDTGPVQIKDPEGEKLFNARFVPKFEAAYDQWTKDGKDPFQFLTQDNVDKLMQGLRSPKEMAMAKLQAQAGVNGIDVPHPPAPEGVDENGWALVMNAAPALNGQPLAADKWQAVVERLVAQPTPQAIAWYDNHFANTGTSAADILDLLGVKPQEGAAPKGDKLPVAPSAAERKEFLGDRFKAAREAAPAAPAPEPAPPAANPAIAEPASNDENEEVNARLEKVYREVLAERGVTGEEAEKRVKEYMERARALDHLPAKSAN